MSRQGTPGHVGNKSAGMAVDPTTQLAYRRNFGFTHERVVQEHVDSLAGKQRVVRRVDGQALQVRDWVDGGRAVVSERRRKPKHRNADFVSFVVTASMARGQQPSALTTAPAKWHQPVTPADNTVPVDGHCACDVERGRGTASCQMCLGLPHCRSRGVVGAIATGEKPLLATAIPTNGWDDTLRFADANGHRSRAPRHVALGKSRCCSTNAWLGGAENLLVHTFVTTVRTATPQLRPVNSPTHQLRRLPVLSGGLADHTEVGEVDVGTLTLHADICAPTIVSVAHSSTRRVHTQATHRMQAAMTHQ